MGSSVSYNREDWHLMCPKKQQFIALSSPIPIEHWRTPHGGQMWDAHQLDWQLFNDMAEQWAWNLLARPHIMSHGEQSESSITTATTAAAAAGAVLAPQSQPLSAIETLPLEVLYLILPKIIPDRKAVLSLGLASPRMWTPVLSYIRSRCLADCAPWAAQPIACWSPQSQTAPSSFVAPGDPSDSMSWQKAKPGSYWLSPNIPYTKEAGLWQKQADILLPPRQQTADGEPATTASNRTDAGTTLKSRARRSTERQTKHEIIVARAAQMPAFSIELPQNCNSWTIGSNSRQMSDIKTKEDAQRCSLLAHLFSISDQRWDEPWLLRNLTKQVYVRLDPPHSFRPSGPSRSAPWGRGFGVNYEDLQPQLKPPKLALRHDSEACCCSVSAEDVLFYHICWGEIDLKISNPTIAATINNGRDQKPPIRGIWAGDSFEIIRQDPSIDLDASEWQDVTTPTATQFTAFIPCSYGQNLQIPKWRVNLSDKFFYSKQAQVLHYKEQRARRNF